MDIQSGELGLQIAADMEALTWERHGGIAIENARRNFKFLARGKSLADLRDLQIGEQDSALIIAAGPSIKRRDPAKLIREFGYRGALIATESSLFYCLRNGIIPHLTISLDPHASRIVRWFGDPELSEEALAQDDYFARQDMDSKFSDEQRANDEILRLMDKYGQKIGYKMPGIFRSILITPIPQTNAHLPVICPIKSHLLH